jgi:hypothetical protein
MSLSSTPIYKTIDPIERETYIERYISTIIINRLEGKWVILYIPIHKIVRQYRLDFYIFQSTAQTSIHGHP